MVKLVGVVSNDDDTKLWQNSRRSLQKISLQRSIAKGWPLVCGVLRTTERQKISPNSIGNNHAKSVLV